MTVVHSQAALRGDRRAIVRLSWPARCSDNVPVSHRRAAIPVVAILLAIGAGVACADQAPATARVERVDDGDTLRVVMNGRPVRVRIFGIDAPELDQPYGRQALDEARRLLANRTVAVVARDTDPYGRLVASLSVDGRDVGTELVRAGAAWHFAQFSDSATLAEAERDARTAGRGLWAGAIPTPPWEYRGDQRAGGLRRSAGAPTPRGPAAGDYHGNVSSRVFHARGCQQFDCASCTAGFTSAADARAAGYRPHGACVR